MFFFREEQSCVRKKNSKEEIRCQNKDSDFKVDSKYVSNIISDSNDTKQKETDTNTLNRERTKKSVQTAVSCHDLESECDEPNKKYSIIHASLKQSISDSINKNEIQTGRTGLVKIQVENCLQGMAKSKPLHPVACTKVKKDVNLKDTQCRMNSPFTTRVNYNSIESITESECVKGSSKGRQCSKASIVRNITKGRKYDTDNVDAIVKFSDPMKKYLWGGNRSSKNQVTVNNSFEKIKIEQDQNNVTEKTLKTKKPAVSSLKKLSRSSLTIEPDKITINLSKYSPCASRLAASSKILSNNSIASPESPLHVVRSKSPSHVNAEVERTLKPLEKMTIQTSLSLNIQQFQRSNLSPRSKSVGDSCVTSPTSEGTTMSYSPTGTEILSLEEVGLQISVTETSRNNQQVKEKLDNECSNKAEKATLETMC